jgi:hypothetical protein
MKVELTPWSKVFHEKLTGVNLVNPLNPELNPICYLLGLRNSLHCMGPKDLLPCLQESATFPFPDPDQFS